MRLLYTFSVRIYYLGILISSLVSKKAKLWLAGRKNLFANLSTKISELRTPNSKLVWVHCASLGEFEHGRPVMEKLKLKDPEIKILLTFFSPSGFEIRKNYSGADYVCYLPMDFPGNVKSFLSIGQSPGRLLGFRQVQPVFSRSGGDRCGAHIVCDRSRAIRVLEVHLVVAAQPVPVFRVVRLPSGGLLPLIQLR